MLYGSKVQIATEHISNSYLDGYEENIKKDLFHHIGDEIYKNLKDTVRKTEAEFKGYDNYDVRVHIYSDEEMKDKFNRLDSLISDLNSETRRKIKDIFVTDNIDRKRKEKTYI